MNESARNLGAAALLLALFASCGTPPTPVLGPDPGPRSVHDLLAKEFSCRIRSWPKTRDEAAALCASTDVLVVMSRHPLVRNPLPKAASEALAEAIRAGKGLLLLGATTRLVHDLGFEPREPDRIGTYRWGLSDETTLGSYVYGAIVKDVAANALVDRLIAEEHEEMLPAAKAKGGKAALGEEYHFGGGELVQVQSCHWEQHDPENGEVLGRLVRIRDGQRRELDSVVLARWSPDKGKVIAIGSMPEPWRSDPRIGANARTLLGNAVRALQHDAAGSRVTLVVDDTRASEPPTTTFAVHPKNRDLPGFPSVVGWGLDVPLSAAGKNRVARKREALLAEWVLPSWRAGASLVQVAPADAELGYPLAWARDDRLSRPGAWFGGEHWPEWGSRGLGQLVGEIHGKGLVAELSLDPAPARAGSKVELFTATRFLARELFDARRLGTRAFDAFLVRSFCADTEGIAIDLVRSFQPNALGFSAQLQAVPLAEFVLTQDARQGRLRGASSSGISEAWRSAFPADEVLAAVVDASTTPGEGSQKIRLGSYPDWIATQAADFVRPRLGRGARIVFEGCDPARDPATFRTVLGIGLEPLRAAVAGRLLATGVGGFRDLEKMLAGSVQSGFGAETALPHDTPFLQNNRVRLCGSGGPLWLDPSGTARFRPGAGTLELSPMFLTTRVRGVKPSTERAPELVIDLLHGSPRGPGGYTEVLSIRGDERGKSSVPAELALAEAPRWPRKIEVMVTLDCADYELELILRGVRGQGVLELRRENEVVRLLRYATGEGSVRSVVPLPVSRPGERTLALEVVSGGAVAIDGWRIVRKDELAAETTTGTPAGWRAELVERTAAGFLVEQKRLATIADLPGFVVQIDYERVDRGIEVRRVLNLPSYKSLARMSPRDKPGLLREPFVLRSDDPNLPLLAIVPIELPRYHRFAMEPDGSLAMIGYPRAHERVRFGVLALGDQDADQLASLPAFLLEACEPKVLELGTDGTCELGSDLPIRWPRVVKIHNPSQSPFLVEEAGNWTLRGGQREETGGDLLLCWQDPGKRVRIRAGQALASSPRPGPGAGGSIAIASDADDRAIARVVVPQGLAGPPAVTFGTSFDEVVLDGKLWAMGSGTTVNLPYGRGVHEILVRTTGRAPYPRLAASRAPVVSCTWNDSEQTLEILVADLGDEPLLRTWPAWIRGPIPLAISGADRIPEEELTYRSDADAQAAEGSGILVRLPVGLTRIRYAPTALQGRSATSVEGAFPPRPR